MSVDRRSPRRSLIVMLAVPVIIAVYGTAIAGRLWAAVRPMVATLLGLTVIGSVYADEAISRAPARVTPARAAIVMALAVTLAGASLAPAPTFAAKPVEQVLAAAQSYRGVKYQWGATGPNRFDCSGYIFRIFKDAGELPRVGGKRMRAVGYFKWFKARGLASKNGKRGDLVVYNAGKHIGIYLGDGKVLSALTKGISVHPLRGINQKVTAFLNVQWGKGDGTGGGESGGDNAPKKGKKDKDKDKDNNGSGGNDDDNGEEVVGGDSDGNDGNEGRGGDRLPRGLATGTLNLRKAPGPDEKIIGWVSKGAEFKVLGTGNSPSGALWLNVEMANGKSGWIWAHWTRIQGR